MTLSNRDKGKLGKDAKILAYQTRDDLGIKETEPITSIRSVLENQDVLILCFPCNEKISGFSIRIEENNCMFINSNHSLGRQHYSMAHEFCHLRYDHGQEPKLSTIENDEDENCDDPYDYRANRFAGFFLMPDEAVESWFKDNKLFRRNLGINDVIRFQHYFGVSYLAALNKILSMGKIYYKKYVLLKKYGEIEYALLLREQTQKLGLDVNLIIPTMQNYVSPRYLKSVILNFQEGRISEDKMDYLLRLMELPDEYVLSTGGVEDD